MVPVLDKNNKPLMPCSEKRARKLLTNKQAFSFWNKGVFCIRLLRNSSDQKFQKIIIGIDPGSKREAYTAVTCKRVILNILTDTPYWVKNAVKTRREMRRRRRYRKTPCRQPRWNNLRNKKFLSPSTKARWQAKLRIIDWLSKIIPITDIIIEDIKAKSKKNQRKWNVSFSPLEIGKEWFYSQIEDKGYNLHAISGYNTKKQRDLRGFVKNNKKLEDSWNAHNIDSHCICEIFLNKIITPIYNILRISFLQFHRRQLHKLNPEKKGIRKRYGGTMSLGFKRGSLIQHEKYGLCFIGGFMKDRISLHRLEDKKRLCRNAKIKNCNLLGLLTWRYVNI